VPESTGCAGATHCSTGSGTVMVLPVATNSRPSTSARSRSGYPGLFSISYDSLTVGAPHGEEPGKPAQPPPQGPTTTAPSPTVSGQDSTTVSPPQSPPLRCRSGYTRARISGQTTCLHQGELCSRRYRQRYRRYHFACVPKGTHYRLVRQRR
jgi:hypothetical protein